MRELQNQQPSKGRRDCRRETQYSQIWLVFYNVHVVESVTGIAEDC